jgi:hypothetical protein
VTITEARERVNAIQKVRHDYERAHAMEDQLRADVLAYLAEVAPAELRALVEIAISTETIDFPRYSA